MPVVKVFAPRAERAALAAEGQLIESYPAFVVLQVADAAVRRLSRRYPVEDISDQYRLPLGGSEIDPLSVQAAPARSRSAARAAAPDDAAHHYLVQFIGPVKRAWVNAVKAAGAVLRHPTGGFGYVVCADAAALARIRALACVRWAGHLPHSDRVAPTMAGTGPAELPRRRSLAGSLAVDVFDAADLPRIAAAAQALGLSVVATDKAARRLSLQAAGPAAQLRQQVQALSAVHGVRWIGERVLPRTSNNVAAGLIGHAFAARPAPGLGLTGAGEVVAVCDTGLDTGDPANIHPDFAGRVVAVRSYPITPYWSPWVLNAGGDDGVADLDTGHGTHVAGSVLGSGAASAATPPRIQGTAPGARLVFQAVEQQMRWRPGAAPPGNPRYLLSGIPDNLEPLFRFAYDHGARIHSNSWGGGEAGAYDEQCRQFDDFVWRRKDMCFVIAAGNDGSDADGDGQINPGSVTSPGTCKNGITVGACENRRAEFNTETYGRWWPRDFPRPPVRDDPMANNPRQVVAFSSRGPTTDGRVKPDVVAPGTFILSTRSSRLAPNNFAWGAYPSNHAYFHMGGTSMATPLVAGCLALIRQHLRAAWNNASPSAALLKAVLIAGAERLPGQASPGVQLDSAQGFGRVELERSLRRLKIAAEGAGLQTGQSVARTLSLTGAARTLRIVLAYSDYPGGTLINNLNLIVTGPDGRRWTGNQRNGVKALVLDGRNNVEVVHVGKARAGTWTIEVVASNVTQGPQDYALVAVQV
ncbi:MAG: S8 family serine peptidase [Rubrivivax sp.]|nr:S8 family serine peptidase [Rubrivivax sp.]